MERTHSLLKRQLKRHFGEGFQIPPHWAEFVAAVNQAYRGFDEDRGMLERSLELSSQELIHANSEMRAIFHALPDLLFRIDPSGTILSFKAAASGDLLLQPQEFFGKRIQDIPIPSISEQFQEAIEKVAHAQELVGFEYSLARQGKECFYEARLSPMLDNQIVVVVRNITERKRAEEQLKRTVSLLQSTLESTADGILVVDRSARVILHNRRFIALWGIPQKLIEARNDEALISYTLRQVRNPDAFLNKIRELYRTPEAEGYDIIELTDGRVFERFSCAQMLDGSPIGRVWTFHDISERRHLEHQLRQAQKMEAFGQLAGGVAHDFNNILTIIQGNLDMLKAGIIKEKDRASAIDMASHASERAANLTRQLLTFSRRQPIQPKELDLNETVIQTTRMLQRLIGEHITLETQYAPGGAPIHADPGMMEQVLMNLALNSRDAMPKGGRLIIRTETVTLASDHVRREPRARAGHFARLSVTDTGAGIAPEHLPHIFEPFFTTKEVGKGTGLGLATVFGIAELHKGWIEVETRLGAGTTFRIYFPASAHPSAPPASGQEIAHIRGGSERILLVEDEEQVRHFVKALLSRYGYEVIEAASGAQALELWRRQPDRIDLVITDMVMPEGLGGRELAEHLWRDNPRLKVLFCSGYTDDMLGPDSILRNNLNFLAKPFDLRILLERVRACLDTPAAPH
jgi:PAS domain S-box-containing protein